MPDLARLLLSLLGALLLSSPALAGSMDDVECCDGLTGKDRARAEQLMEQHYLYDCCEDTVAVCLEEAKPCPLAERLTGEICRRVKAGESNEEIDIALKKRARSMMPGGPTVKIDHQGVPTLGDPGAPVQATLYACARCPFCATTTLALEEALAPGGQLHGKVYLHFKIFPLKSHAGSVEAGLAAIAAHQQGKFWPLMNKLYTDFGAFSIARIPSWAEESGLDMAVYNKVVTDPSTRDILVAWKREGLANGVQATPTLFINGRYYHGDMHADQLIDVLLEEYERLSAD